VDEPGDLTFGPDRRIAYLTLPAAAIAGVASLIADGAASRVVAALAAVILVLIGTSTLYFRPRLRVTRTGLRVFGPFDRVSLDWSVVESVRAISTTRRGLRSTVLEISAGERLVVLDRWDLASDPELVQRRIAEYRLTT
jgi:hypothetical protein